MIPCNGRVRILTLIVLLCAAPFAWAGRFALVIGNDGYQDAPLHNPVNDARLIGKVFKETLGFDDVTVKENVRLDELHGAVEAFLGKLRDADSAVLYFSGHGMQDDARIDYLLPVDAVIDSPFQLSYKALSVQSVMDRINQLGVDRPRVTLVVLDACRNNPYSGRKGGSKGLARIDAGDGVLIAYATREDSVAQDGTGANSPYAMALAQALAQRNLPIMQALDVVHDQVEAQTRGTQSPTRTGDLRATAFLIPPPAAGSASAQSPDAFAAELSAFNAAQSANTVPAWQIFKQRYPHSAYGATADIQLTMLTHPSSGTIPPNAGSGAGSAEPRGQLAGTIWTARFEPNVLPLWKDCPRAQITLAADQEVGVRCTPGDQFAYIGVNAWHNAGSKLEITFANGWTYQFPTESELRKDRELVASAPTDPNKIVLHIQYVERGVAAFSDSQSGGRIASTGGGDTVGHAELEGSIWGARLQPVGLPWWKDCPGAQLILAAHGKMGFRCTANDVTTYVAENSWQSVDQKLEVRFNNGQFIYTFKLAPGTQQELRSPEQHDPGIALYIRRQSN